jgi:hypothetical protein
MKRISICLAGLLMLWAAFFPPLLRSATTNWPNLMNYQGHLRDASGNAVADGPYSINFNIYPASSGGSSLWSETQTVTVTKGLFNAVLGSATSMSSIALSSYTSDLWIGITVGSDAEMTPRQQLLPAPFAKNALSLNGLVTGTAATNLVQLDGSGKIPAGLVQGGSLTPPFDMIASSANYLLNVSNTSATSTALGLKVLGPNAVLALATDPAGAGLWGQSAAADGAAGVGLRGSANNGIGVLAQTIAGTGLSVTSQSTTNAALFVSAALPAKFSVPSGASNIGLNVFTTTGSQVVNLVDRVHQAGVFSSVTLSPLFGVSATALVGTGVYGATTSLAATDYGVWGVNTVNTTSGVGVNGSGFIGVQGLASAATGIGVQGIHAGSGAGFGVRGSSASGSGAMGVFGTVTGSASVGVGGNGGAADSYGVLGFQNNASPVTYAAGVLGKAIGSFAGMGVRGEGYQGVYGLGNGNAYCGVCAYTNNSTGYGLYASSSFKAVFAEASNGGIQAFGVDADVQATAAGSAAGRFQAQGVTGTTYGVYAADSSGTGYGVWSSSHFVNYNSDPSSGAVQFGFSHSDNSPPPGGIGVFAQELCDNCFAGDFINTSATNSGAGAALNVQGRIRVVAGTGAGTFFAAAGSPSVVLSSGFVTSNCLIFLTAANATSSTASVTAQSPGNATITFMPPLATDTTYQYLIIGQ